MPSALAGSLWPSVEQRLLLEAALFPGERGRKAFLEWRTRVDPDRDFSWNTLRLLPLVYANLHRQRLADPLMARLKGVYRRTWCETHQLFHRTAPALAALVAAGCDVLLLKGAPLALSYYGNHALRPMADVDLWVPRRQLSRAAEVLRTAGFISSVPWSSDTVRFRHAVQFVRPSEDGGTELDLHWHVLFEAPDDGLDAAIWATSEPLDFVGVPVRQLDPTAMLLNVVLHGMRWNEESPVRWIPDALTVLRSREPAVDWPRLIAYAEDHKLTHRLWLGLSYLRRTFEAPIPEAPLAALGRPPSLLERVENTVMLADGARLTHSMLGTYWAGFAEYCRYSPPGGPLAFLSGYSHYLRIQWGLSGRRELIPAFFRRLRSRLLRDSGSAVAAFEAERVRATS